MFNVEIFTTKMSNMVSGKGQYLFNNQSGDSAFQSIPVLLGATNDTYQYTPNTTITFVFLGLDAVLYIPTIYALILILRMVKRQERKQQNTLLCKPLKISVHFHLVSVPYLIINGGIISSIFPTSEVLGSVYCHVYQICIHIIGVYVGTFSLLAASSRLTKNTPLAESFCNVFRIS